MAEAIICAALQSDLLEADQIIASDPGEDRGAALQKSLGIAVTGDNSEAITESEQVLLATKPQQMGVVAKDIASAITNKQIVISIMAGITTQKLAQSAGKSLRIVRVMPNTPVMVGSGMSGIALGEDAQQGDDDLALRLFSS